jgi:type I restriction enzyme, S subunit
LAKRVTQRNTHGAKLRTLTNSAEHGVVDQREYFDKDIATNTDNYYIVQTGDYVYNPRVSSAAPVGPISKNRIGTGVMSPLYTVLRFQSEASDFFAHYFKSSHWHGYLRRVSNSGARHDRMAITYDDLMRMPIPTPSPREQQKISDCLGSLDDLIAAEGRKLEALRQHKQGLMQQLFPLPDETLPRLRFPEFHDVAEWRISPLGEFIEEYREKSTSQDEFEVLTSARNGLVRQRDYYDNDRITERDNVGFNVIPPNYLTYRSRSDNRKFYFNENNLGITGIISTYYPVFRINGGSSRFFIGLLSHHADLVGKHSVGTSQTVLSLNELRRIQLPFPSHAEQQKIAHYLTSVDDQFDAQARKLDALKQHKEGLLHQLFPSFEAEVQ